METLVNDFRFTLYNVCYKRVLLVWVLFALSVLLGLLFSGLKGIALFSLGVGWLFLNAAAIFICMWIKLCLARGLERCLAAVNKQLVRHKIVLALDDRGRISCHKVNLCFMYYDPEQCVNYLNEFIERSEQNGTMIEAGWESRLDVDANDIVIQGSTTTRVSRKQVRVPKPNYKNLSEADGSWSRIAFTQKVDTTQTHTECPSLNETSTYSILVFTRFVLKLVF